MGGRPRRALEAARDRAGGHQVEQRIPVGELVEVHPRPIDAVHGGLRVGEQVEQRQRVSPRAIRQRGGGKAVLQLGMRGAGVGFIGLAFARVQRSRCMHARASCNARPRAEAPRTQAAVDGRPQCRRCPVRGPRSRELGEHRRLEPRQRVDHRGDEHVARDPAHGIEVQREPRRIVSRPHQPTTGTTYGPSGITAMSGSPALATLSATAASTESTLATPVSLRSSASSPVV